MKSALFYRACRYIALVLTLSSLQALASEKTFEFDKASTKATIEILNQLDSGHYKHIAINDDFSALLMDAYLDALDPSRVIFTAEDIQDFQRYRQLLDDQISKGNLEAISYIYNRYYQRQKFLLERSLADVKRYSAPYNAADAVIELDREHATRPANIEASIALWDKRVYNDALTLKLSGKALDAIPGLLQKRFEERVRRLDSLTNDDRFEIFANSLTALYDPHTDWLSPKAQENFKISMSLSLQGIGAVLQMDEEKTKIVSLVTGGPAAKSGELTPGDYILGVGQGKQGEIEDVIGWRLDEVVQLVRGEKGSYVRLQIESAETKALKMVILQREQVKLEDQAAKSTIMEVPSSSHGKSKKIGIINVPAFYMNFEAYREGDNDFRSTTKDVMNLLEDLKTAGVDGIVLDLRNNGGGSLRESATFTNLFVDQGPVVQIRSSDNQIDRSLRSQHPAYYTGPILVLINHLSASATEIFAGAIQDYRRGLVVGEQSFGKGTVQTIADLDYGELKLTTAKFYRISGDSTQNRGVVPDITFPSIFDFKLVGESALDNALPWDSIHAVTHFQYDDPVLYRDELEKNSRKRMSKSPDYQTLLKKIDFLRAKQDIKTLSLDEKIRLADRKADDKTLLEIANTLRLKKGEKAFKTIEELEKYDADRAALTTSKTTIDTENDFLLRESAKILSDFVDLQTKNAVENAVSSAR